MGAVTLFILALGLSADAFAVSVSNSLCFDGLRRRDCFSTSLLFGVFQGVMPLIGYFAGRAFADVISGVDHWVAFVLLVFIGGKMIFDALREWNEPVACPVKRVLSVKMVLVQAIATSIDALAVGVSLAALDVNIWLAAAFIAVITFICCLVGHLIGRKVGGLVGNWAQVAGGVILVGIGVKILIEHTFF
ncbi:MAG: manganese efflux pump MntP family protein [Ruthenibacterium sp.]